MTAKELARKLDGRQYLHEITIKEKNEAKAAGLVVVYGASDDLIEFECAIYDEVDAWNGTTVYLTKAGIFRKPSYLCDEAHDRPDCKAALESCKKIYGVFAGEGWKFTTDIPCERFTIYEDEDVYGEGLVFSINDL